MSQPLLFVSLMETGSHLKDSESLQLEIEPASLKLFILNPLPAI